MGKIKVLFITPETQRAGAPLQLFNFISWLIEKELAEPVILLSSRGSIDEDFQKLGKTFFYYYYKPAAGKNIFSKIGHRVFNSSIGKRFYLRRLRDHLSAFKPELVYSNTIVNGDMLEFCNFLHVPVITHVHESGYLTGLYGERNLAAVKRYSSHFIACSNHVRQSLINLQIPAEQISLVYSSVNKDAVAHIQAASVAGAVESAVKSGKKIIGSSGGLGWLKGSDLVVPFIKELLKTEPDICFLWVGGNPASIEYKQALTDIRNTGLQNNIIITGTVNNPLYYFSLMDVFVLLSREDSFPLVCLENSLLFNPVVCFEKSGGATELLADWPDNIIPYLDIAKLSERVLEILNDKPLREKIGDSMRKKVTENFDSEKCFPEIFKIMQNNFS